MNTLQKIGLFGFGCVGQGLYDIFTKTAHFQASVKRICIRDAAKTRSIEASWFTLDKYEILDDPEINCIVELIDDADEAYHIVREALLRGKDVVTANKKMLAQHLAEFIDIQHSTGAGLLYEGSACGSIPIIRNLEEYYDHEPLLSISGIFNGSSNFILSRIFQDQMPYGLALKQAQDLGFAESDPSLDVGGFDAKYKLVILTAHSFGELVDPAQVFNLGIENLSENDIRFCREKGLRVKLLASASKRESENLSMYVMPCLIPESDFLFAVENEFNAVKVETTFADRQNFYGKGAGGHPTGAAVLSDISALGYHYRYEYKKFKQSAESTFNNEVMVEVYLRYNHAALLDELNFSRIIQKFEGGDYRYVIGAISLSRLIDCRASLLADASFLALSSFIPVNGRHISENGASIKAGLPLETHTVATLQHINPPESHLI